MTKGSGTTKTPTAKLVRTVIYLQPEGYNALKLAAAERGVSASEVVRRALLLLMKIEDRREPT
jgi:hypothetical protein